MLFFIGDSFAVRDSIRHEGYTALQNDLGRTVVQMPPFLSRNAQSPKTKRPFLVRSANWAFPFPSAPKRAMEIFTMAFGLRSLHRPPFQL